MAGKVQFGLVNAGYLASGIEPFCLSPNGNKVSLYRMVRLHSIEEHKGKKENKVDSRPAMPLLEMVVSSPAAVWFTNALVPEEIYNYFKYASRKAQNDFKRLVSAIVFLPQLTLNGEWERGFEYSLVRSLSGENGEQWSRFIKEAPELLPEYRKTMFVNRTGSMGGRLEYQDLFVTMGWELGRMKIDALLSAKGYAPDTLSAKARDIYAYIYTKEMAERMGQNIPRLNNELLLLFTQVPQREIDLALRFLTQKKS